MGASGEKSRDKQWLLLLIPHEICLNYEKRTDKNGLCVYKQRKHLCCFQEEDCKPKTQRKVKEEVKEAFEPKLLEDDPLSVLTTIIAQVLQRQLQDILLLNLI